MTPAWPVEFGSVAATLHAEAFTVAVELGTTIKLNSATSLQQKQLPLCVVGPLWVWTGPGKLQLALPFRSTLVSGSAVIRYCRFFLSCKRHSACLSFD